MGLFNDRTKYGKDTGVPVWFMRQAGRYHDHYQNIKKNSDFMTMCKTPQLACDITMGPIDEFDFDAAILFSDLLFPLEHLGMGLTYDPGPILSFKIDEKIEAIKETEPASTFYRFQKEATSLLRKTLPKEKTLLGFVGAPFTLYAYACEGSHAGNLIASKKGLYNGLWDQFLEHLLPSVETEMTLQAEGGADAVCIFDTAVGELSLHDFKKFALPALRCLTANFKMKYPDKKIIYYSKHTNLTYLHQIADKNIDVLGVDWRLDLKEVVNSLSSDYYIQGNMDPSWLHLPWDKLKDNMLTFWNNLNGINHDRWICGLGHGVLPKTPQDNVKKAVGLIHEVFRY